MKQSYPADRVRSKPTFVALREAERAKLDELVTLTGKSRSTLVRTAFLKQIDGMLTKARAEKAKG